MDDDGRIPYLTGEEDFERFVQTDDGDECPLCQSGTVEHSPLGDYIACRGECGFVTDPSTLFRADAEGNIPTSTPVRRAPPQEGDTISQRLFQNFIDTEDGDQCPLCDEGAVEHSAPGDCIRCDVCHFETDPRALFRSDAAGMTIDAGQLTGTWEWDAANGISHSTVVGTSYTNLNGDVFLQSEEEKEYERRIPVEFDPDAMHVDE